MASPCRLLLLPAELRICIYRHTFHNFTLELSDENTFAPPNRDTTTGVNQLCKVSKQVRHESIPILASCTRTIVACTLLPHKPNRLASDSDPKPQTVSPPLHPSFRTAIHALFLSSQCAFIPDSTSFPHLRKIAVDAWLYNDALLLDDDDDDDDDKHSTTTDAHLVAVAKADVAARAGAPEDVFPVWLEDLAAQAQTGVKLKLAVRTVWMVDETESATSYLKALVNVTDGVVVEREWGSKRLEEVDLVPPAWLFE